MNKTKNIFFVLASTCITLLSMVCLANYMLLQKKLSDVINSDSRNMGINISVNYAYYVSPSTLVINVKGIEKDKSPADVFRVLLQYAEKMSMKKFDRIELSSNGKTKFILEGVFFKTLGEEYETQNPVYTMRTFPENLYRPDGQKAFGRWEGGLLGVLGKQMGDFTEFHKQWYIEDMN